MPNNPKYLLLVVCLLAASTTLPWLGLSDFYTKGEPREACAALSMLTENRWVLPHSYVDEFGFKPPLMHWIIAGFSLLFGGISEMICRLPSALSMVGMALFMFLFVQKRTCSKRAFLASLLFVSSFEVHRFALECRVDMTLAFFMVMALILLYRWWEKGQQGYPLMAALMLSFAGLVKGPVGIVLPLLSWMVFVWLKKEKIGSVLIHAFMTALPAILILACWYYLAWLDSGKAFLHVAFAENVGRLLGMDRETLGIPYQLGHHAPFWFYFPAIFIGLLPWSLLLILAGLKWLFASKITSIRSYFSRNNLSGVHSLTLFSIMTAVVFILFYTLSASKRSVYILPVYPFAAYLMSVLFEKAELKFPTFFRTAGTVFWMLSLLLLLAFAAICFFPVSTWFDGVTLSDKTRYDLSLFAAVYLKPTLSMIVGWTVLFGATVFFLLKKSIRLQSDKTIYSVLLLVFMQVFLESAVYPVYKNGYSVQPVAASLQSEFGPDTPIYVMSDLKNYRNIYGINYYLSHKPMNFEQSEPRNGLLLVAASNLPKVQQKYTKNYRFVVLKTYKPYNELNDEILACQIVAL